MNDIVTASDADVPALVRLINRAYEIEKFFVSGERTNAANVRHMQRLGVFLTTRDAAGDMIACVYVELKDTRAYFGLLSVDPARQHSGIGRSLVHAAEALARDAGCVAMDIRVVNLRLELPAFYRRLGYTEVGVEPATEPRALQSFHFIRMSKAL